MLDAKLRSFVQQDVSLAERLVGSADPSLAGR
jgi:hypothetical protein